MHSFLLIILIAAVSCLSYAYVKDYYDLIFPDVNQYVFGFGAFYGFSMAMIAFGAYFGVLNLFDYLDGKRMKKKEAFD